MVFLYWKIVNNNSCHERNWFTIDLKTNEFKLKLTILLRSDPNSWTALQFRWRKNGSKNRFPSNFSTTDEIKLFSNSIQALFALRRLLLLWFCLIETKFDVFHVSDVFNSNTAALQNNLFLCKAQTSFFSTWQHFIFILRRSATGNDRKTMIGFEKTITWIHRTMSTLTSSSW